MVRPKRRNKDKSSILNKNYYNAKRSAGFGGYDKLQKSVNGKVKKRETRRWLMSRDAYTLHKPVNRKFKRRKYIVSGIDALWQADLTDFTSLSKSNDNYRFILFIIDAFSRQAFATPIKNKSCKEVTEAFRGIISSTNRSPVYLSTDRGTEFLCKGFQDMLSENKIVFYTTYSQETKASFIERLQRTIKQKLFRYFTYSGTTRYIDVLQDFIEGYNDTHHSSIKVKPKDVDYTNQGKLWNEQYFPDDYSTAKPTFKFRPGDTVRVSKYKSTFSKGYQQLWSNELFTVVKAHHTNPPVYTIADQNNEVIKGTWYENELQKVIPENDVHKIEKILSTRKINGKSQYLVRWNGYGPEFDSYIDRNQLITNYKN